MTPEIIPAISVCIPVYNCERYVGAAIESVLAQTWQNFELVVLDNCSTDGTVDIVRRYGDPRIRVVENEKNIGACGNWNRALSEARGPFLKIVCADDLLYPTCLERQLALLTGPANGGVALVCCHRDVIGERGRKVLSRRFTGANGRLSGRVAIRENMRAGTNLIGEPTAVMFRRGLLPAAGPFKPDNPYVIDLDLWVRLLLLGDIQVIPEPLCAFRVSAGSWSCQVVASQSRDFCALIDSMGADSRFGLSFFDVTVGRVRAHLNRVLRRVFYRIVLRGRPASP